MRGTSYALCYGRVRSCAIHKRPFKNDVTRVGWEGYPKLVTKVGTVRGVLLPSTDVNADITTKKKNVQVFICPLVLVSTVADESKAKNVDKLEDALVIPDGPCLIPCMKVFLMDTFETSHE